MRVVDGRLTSVVEVRGAVPDPIALANLHVIHLLGKKGVESGVPNSGVDVVRDAQGPGGAARIFNEINAGVANRRKIEKSVLIAEPFAPWLYLPTECLFVRTVRAEFHYPSGGR